MNKIGLYNVVKNDVIIYTGTLYACEIYMNGLNDKKGAKITHVWTAPKKTNNEQQLNLF